MIEEVWIKWICERFGACFRDLVVKMLFSVVEDLMWHGIFEKSEKNVRLLSFLSNSRFVDCRIGAIFK